MNKPTKAQIEAASSRQLAEWSAVWVMGLRKEEYPTHTASGLICNREIWMNKDNSFIWIDEWNPAENIAQAWQIIEKLKTDAWNISIHTFMGIWSVDVTCSIGPCELHHVDIGPRCHGVEEIEAKTASRAITIAALLAKTSQ